MPLSRQTSRMVWPSKPSTTRPSTSMRMPRRRLRPLRRLRLDEAVGSVSAPGPSRSGQRSALGAGEGVGHREASVASRLGTAGGVELGPEVSHPARQRERRKSLVVTERRRDDVVGEVRGELRYRPGGASPSSRRPTISARRFVPIRQGIDLPQASFEQKRVRTPTSSTRSVWSSTATTDPDPRWAPAARSDAKSYGVSSASGGSSPPDGPPMRTALSVASGRQLATELEDVAQRRPERDLGDAVPARRPELDEDRPGAPVAADGPEGLGTLADDPWHGGQGLDVVDDGRPVEQPALGRVRWPLLRLAALALEGLEQDRLLAEHVRALDRADRQPQVVAGAEDVCAEEAGVGRRADGRGQPGDDVGVLGADRDERLARADRERRRWPSLDDRVRVPQHQRAVGVRRRVGAVAVGHDVAPVGVGAGGGPPLVSGREARAAPSAQAGRGDQGDSGRPAPSSRTGRAAAPRTRPRLDGRIEVARILGVGAGQEDRRPAAAGVFRRSPSSGPRRLAPGRPCARRARAPSAAR